MLLVISYLFVHLFRRHGGIDDKLIARLFFSFFFFSYKWKEIKIGFLKRIIIGLWILDTTSSPGIDYLELSN